MCVRLLTVLFLVAVLACDAAAPTDTPGEDSVIGLYEASEFSVTQSGDTINVLELGGSLQLRLQSDSTILGFIVVPGEIFGSDPITADINGSWTQEGGVISLDLSEDLFLRDISFEIRSDDGIPSLHGSGTFDTVQVSIVLDGQ